MIHVTFNNNNNNARKAAGREISMRRMSSQDFDDIFVGFGGKTTY